LRGRSTHYQMSSAFNNTDAKYAWLLPDCVELNICLLIIVKKNV
jgi:hypothetical protein